MQLFIFFSVAKCHFLDWQPLWLTFFQFYGLGFNETSIVCPPESDEVPEAVGQLDSILVDRQVELKYTGNVPCLMKPRGMAIGLKSMALQIKVLCCLVEARSWLAFVQRNPWLRCFSWFWEHVFLWYVVFVPNTVIFNGGRWTERL